MIGLMGVVNSLNLFLLKTSEDLLLRGAARIFWLPALLIGLVSLITYHRVDVTSLSPGGKRWLWGAVGVAGVFTAVSLWLVKNEGWFS